MYRSWELWLKGVEQHCSMTFDSKCASDNRNAMFIMPLHPLVIQGANYFKQTSLVYTSVRVSDSDIEPGTYTFAIYSWKYHGLRPAISLVPVCLNKNVRENLFDYLESGVAFHDEKSALNKPQIQEIEKVHHGIWEKEKQNHLHQTKQMCAYRLESLNTSMRGRRNVVEEQLSSTTNENIHRMKQGELKNINADYQKQKDKIEKAMSRVDIHAQPIVFGKLRVEN